VAADRVDLVHEDDRGRAGLGLLEEVAHRVRRRRRRTSRTKSDPEIEKNGAPAVARDRAGEQRLAGAGRAVEQHALRDLGADRLELGRRLEELLDLL